MKQVLFRTISVLLLLLSAPVFAQDARIIEWV